MPGRDIYFVRGYICLVQIHSARPSYINAVLIQSRGVLVPGGCNICRTRLVMRPFPECRILFGHFGDSCGNYKWPDHASRYRHNLDDSDGHDNEDEDEDEDEDGSSDSSETLVGDSPPGRTGRLLPAPRGAGGNLQVVIYH